MTAPNPQAGWSRGAYEILPRKAAGLDNDSTTTRRYFITGAEDEEDAIELLGLAAPVTLNNLIPSQPDIEEIVHETGTYVGTLVYVAPDSPDAQREREDNWPAPKLVPLKMGMGVRWSWRGQANQLQIQATAEDKVTPFPPAATGEYRTFYGAINVDPDNQQVGGTNRYFVSEEWTAEIVVEKSVVTQSFLDGLRALELTTNASVFASTMFSLGTSISFEAKAALYLTCQGDEEEDGVRLRFSFLVGKNETSLSVGGITGITRNAHDYLWPLWETMVDTVNDNYLIRKANRIYVHELYEAKSWSALEAILS